MCKRKVIRETSIIIIILIQSRLDLLPLPTTWQPWLPLLQTTSAIQLLQLLSWIRIHRKHWSIINRLRLLFHPELLLSSIISSWVIIMLTIHRTNHRRPEGPERHHPMEPSGQDARRTTTRNWLPTSNRAFRKSSSRRIRNQRQLLPIMLLQWSLRHLLLLPLILLQL